MCMFPIANMNYKGEVYRKGLDKFDCGACPECLGKRARSWALRSVYEARDSVACMVTLTYDTYKRDENGKIIGENPVDITKQVNKRDCQLFMKRLRKHFSDIKIKYLITAEYGKRTHRAHYHALLFGVEWPDLIYYKKSKRGNVIYKSHTLTKIWQHGICTVDAINVSAQVARYCTKYCAKDARADDTFMLVSRGIGERGLLRDFNGISYWVDGREYPIPKQIWQKFITDRNFGSYPEFTYKYKNVESSDYEENVKQRREYRRLRDTDPDYIYYLAYWSNKVQQYERKRPDVLTRILQLPNEKYFGYKQKALHVYNDWKRNVPSVAPRSGCKAEFWNWRYGSKYLGPHLPCDSCHERANDTMPVENPVILFPYLMEDNPFDNPELFNSPINRVNSQLRC